MDISPSPLTIHKQIQYVIWTSIRHFTRVIVMWLILRYVL